MKRIRLTTRPLAEREIDNAAASIADDNPDASIRFLDAIDHARTELVRFPEIGAIRRFDSPALSGLRVWPIPGFENWMIFYRIEEDRLTVVRVLHGARELPTALNE